MLTRFVRNQLIIFTIASIIGVAVMLFAYMQVPTLLGIGRLDGDDGVALRRWPLPVRQRDLPRRADRQGDRGEADRERCRSGRCRSNTSPKIPADLQADVLSVSAVGEQYVDLRPRTDSGPYLQDGSRIPVDDTTIPQEVGPMLDQVSKLVDTIPGDRISDLLDESFKAFNGAGPDFQSLFDSASKLTGDINGVSDETRG